MMQKKQGKTVKVTGELSVLWTVELPVERAREGVTTDDPAINAALDFLPQSGFVYLWGEDAEPVEVWFEASEADCEVQDDDRKPLCYVKGCWLEAECTLNEADGAIVGHFCKEHGRIVLAKQIERESPC